MLEVAPLTARVAAENCARNLNQAAVLLVYGATDAASQLEDYAREELAVVAAALGYDLVPYSDKAAAA